jgi:hypothetical protein
MRTPTRSMRRQTARRMSSLNWRAQAFCERRSCFSRRGRRRHVRRHCRARRGRRALDNRRFRLLGATHVHRVFAANPECRVAGTASRAVAQRHDRGRDGSVQRDEVPLGHRGVASRSKARCDCRRSLAPRRHTPMGDESARAGIRCRRRSHAWRRTSRLDIRYPEGCAGRYAQRGSRYDRIARQQHGGTKLHGRSSRSSLATARRRKRFSALCPPRILSLQCGLSIGLARRSLTQAAQSQEETRRILHAEIESAVHDLESASTQLIAGIENGLFRIQPSLSFELGDRACDDRKHCYQSGIAGSRWARLYARRPSRLRAPLA